MKDRIDSFAVLGDSAANSGIRNPGKAFPRISLPKMIYEALPAAYMCLGTLFMLGTAYIGIDHGPVIGYLAAGLLCIGAGVTVASIRCRERSKAAYPSA